MLPLNVDRTFRSLAYLPLAGLLCALGVNAGAQEATIRINAAEVTGHVSRLLTGACIEDVNHEIYGGLYSQMIFGESFQEPSPPAPATGATTTSSTATSATMSGAVSGMWRPLRRGAAEGSFALEATQPFAGTQSQRLTLTTGAGEIGIENQGLNRWGLHFTLGKPYEGYVWARTDQPAQLPIALESRDGATVYAETSLAVTSAVWQRLDFTLTPNAGDEHGRLALKLRQPGSVVVGHAFLQPGEWGRFKGLPVRRDVAKGLIDQGITVLRYGGSMVNHPEYRWKKMIGPRDRRPPSKGTWYPYSTNGWGIVDFLNFCEAAGFECIPDFNIDETPQDLAYFIDYAKTPAESEWGRRRAADGHPAPYPLRYLELGNEERIDDHYFERFKPLAEAIWAKDPTLILVVGDFVYTEPIHDPLNFGGALSKITTLDAHRKILALARQHDREVWFDVHIATDGPDPSPDLHALPTYVQALEQVSGGARHKVVVFEFNAGNHQQRRALANAWAINTIERLDGRVAVACSANCLQPDGQNDNDWNQGLLFLNPGQVWLQPPGYVTQMVSRHWQPLLVKTEVQGAGDKFDVNAKRSEDGKTLTMQVVNRGDAPIAATIALIGFTPANPVAMVEELAGPLDAVNTATDPQHLTPRVEEWPHGFAAGPIQRAFPPHSFTIMQLR